MDRAYDLYGLQLVADGEIPGLCGRELTHPHDVRVWLTTVPDGLTERPRTRWYQSPELNECGRPNLIIWRLTADRSFHFAYDDGVQFLIRGDGAEIWCCWPPEATVADASVYLRGPISAMTLRLRGVVPLHASAIAVGDRAVAVLGAAGAGKSTTAAAFSKLGHPILSDDVTALSEFRERFHAMPGYPWVNLWPDSAEAIFGETDSLPRLTPADGINHRWDKRYLDLSASGAFCRGPLPLAAVYVLGERSSDEREVGMKPLSPREALIEITRETCMNYALDEFMRVLEFRTLGRLVNTIPVRLVTPYNSRARITELCEDILHDCTAPA